MGKFLRSGARELFIHNLQENLARRGRTDEPVQVPGGCYINIPVLSLALSLLSDRQLTQCVAHICQLFESFFNSLVRTKANTKARTSYVWILAVLKMSEN